MRMLLEKTTTDIAMSSIAKMVKRFKRTGLRLANILPSNVLFGEQKNTLHPPRRLRGQKGKIEMPNARHTLKVTFEEATEKIRGIRKSEMVVRFRYRNNNDEEVSVKSLKASALYKDWYNNCNICPANDAPLSHLHILLNPICTALDVTGEVTFEQLMDMIEEVTVGHKCCA